ncbi:hypothetical protein BDZ91DRAFT_765045 [Kalaharituber pfeilii]|nr:hypothetical protein BDZ91DRAFT_765045 [Kalaharituber pfeilii]
MCIYGESTYFLGGERGGVIGDGDGNGWECGSADGWQTRGGRMSWERTWCIKYVMGNGCPLTDGGHDELSCLGKEEVLEDLVYQLSCLDGEGGGGGYWSSWYIKYVYNLYWLCAYINVYIWGTAKLSCLGGGRDWSAWRVEGKYVYGFLAWDIKGAVLEVMGVDGSAGLLTAGGHDELSCLGKEEVLECMERFRVMGVDGSAGRLMDGEHDEVGG